MYYLDRLWSHHEKSRGSRQSFYSQGLFKILGMNLLFLSKKKLYKTLNINSAGSLKMAYEFLQKNVLSLVHYFTTNFLHQSKDEGP